MMNLKFWILFSQPPLAIRVSLVSLNPPAHKGHEWNYLDTDNMRAHLQNRDNGGFGATLRLDDVPRECTTKGYFECEDVFSRDGSSFVNWATEVKGYAVSRRRARLELLATIRPSDDRCLLSLEGGSAGHDPFSEVEGQETAHHLFGKLHSPAQVKWEPADDKLRACSVYVDSNSVNSVVVDPELASKKSKFIFNGDFFPI